MSQRRDWSLVFHVLADISNRKGEGLHASCVQMGLKRAVQDQQISQTVKASRSPLPATALIHPLSSPWRNAFLCHVRMMPSASVYLLVIPVNVSRVGQVRTVATLCKRIMSCWNVKLCPNVWLYLSIYIAPLTALHQSETLGTSVRDPEKIRLSFSSKRMQRTPLLKQWASDGGSWFHCNGSNNSKSTRLGNGSSQKFKMVKQCSTF